MNFYLNYIENKIIHVLKVSLGLLAVLVLWHSYLRDIVTKPRVPQCLLYILKNWLNVGAQVYNLLKILSLSFKLPYRSFNYLFQT